MLTCERYHRWRGERGKLIDSTSVVLFSPSQRLLFRKNPKAVRASRLLQRWYNGWWVIGMAAVNCIMSVRWWDHDHGKVTRHCAWFSTPGPYNFKVVPSSTAGGSEREKDGEAWRRQSKWTLIRNSSLIAQSLKQYHSPSTSCCFCKCEFE